MLTYDEIRQTSVIIEEAVENRLRMTHLGDVEVPLRNQDYSRVYRLLVKHVIPAVGGVPPQLAYVDAVFADHHNASGMSPDRSIAAPGTATDHICTDLCQDSVRLIHVGQEDLLERLLSWWFIRCQYQAQPVETMVVEQDASLAQEQIRANGCFPLFVYDELQLIIADPMIKEVVSHGSTNPTWVLI